MKKIMVAILISPLLMITFFIIWQQLPITINRSSDIHFGEQIIKNIENYQSENCLPNNYDWKTLRKLGFRDKIDFLEPEYRKVDNETFELIYVEGFDGPYLMWNSKERIWKEGYPTFPAKEQTIQIINQEESSKPSEYD